jgi:plastocyanin
MLRRLTSLALFLLSSLAVTAMPPQAPGGAEPTSVNFEGKLTLVGSNKSIKDASQIVFWLTPLDHPGPPDPPQQHFRVTQRDKKFDPSFLVIPQGSTVDFPNLDPWFHNVFSQFRGKRFDLGLYQAGSQRSVKFDMAGVSYLFCNIHPDMTAIIVSVDSNFYAVSDKSGHARITNLPAGKYELHVWQRDATPESLNSAQRVLEVDQNRTLVIQIRTKPQSKQGHKNKYGHDYDPDSLNPQY